jgi:hypothetical protein
VNGALIQKFRWTKFTDTSCDKYYLSRLTMCRPVKCTNVSEECNASNFIPKCKPSKNVSMKQRAGRANKQTLFVTCFLLALLFKLEDAHHFSETLVDLYWTTWYCIPEDCTLHSHYCVNLKPNISCELLKVVPVQIVVFWVVTLCSLVGG